MASFAKVDSQFHIRHQPRMEQSGPLPPSCSSDELDRVWNDNTNNINSAWRASSTGVDRLWYTAQLDLVGGPLTSVQEPILVPPQLQVQFWLCLRLRAFLFGAESELSVAQTRIA